MKSISKSAAYRYSEQRCNQSRDSLVDFYPRDRLDSTQFHVVFVQMHVIYPGFFVLQIKSEQKTRKGFSLDLNISLGNWRLFVNMKKIFHFWTKDLILNPNAITACIHTKYVFRFFIFIDRF